MTTLLQHASHHDTDTGKESSMAAYMLTTSDNPHSPYTAWDRWLEFEFKQHNGQTLSLLGRVINYSDELSEADKDIAIEDAIDTIIREDPELIYKKISSPKTK